MEMVVENGRGYVPATEHSRADQEIGIIPIDAVYSPVVRGALRGRGDPRRPEDELRQADARDLDQRLGPSRDGAGRSRPRFSASTSTRSCSIASLVRVRESDYKDGHYHNILIMSILRQEYHPAE